MSSALQEKLSEILESHLRWLYDEEGGSRADLRGAVLSGADLSGADLRDAVLRDADLRGADLSGTSLDQELHNHRKHARHVVSHEQPVLVQANPQNAIQVSLRE